MSKHFLALAYAVALVACGHDDPAVVAKDAMKVCGNKNSNDTKARLAACNTAISTGELNEAEISDAYRSRASAYSRLNDYQGALADLDLLMMRQPNNAKALAERGSVHEHLRDHDLAIADLEQSIRLDGGSLSAFGYLGDAYRSKRDFDRAEVSYGHAIDMGKGYTGPWTMRCFTRAIIGKDVDGALADCNEAMKLTSREPGSLAPVLSYRCFAQYRMKHYREAVQDCDAAMAHGSTYSNEFYVRGLAKRALGDASASDDINHAKEINPNIAKTYAVWGVPETP
jgi:tetratricopeptide (TPR) repeat protein